MAIKQRDILSRVDFDQAVVRLRLNVSEIAKEVSVPRTYLSEFRNGDRALRPEHQAKLRDYFESKGIEFEDGPNAAAPAAVASPHPRLNVVEAARCYFPVCDTVSDEVIGHAMDAMEENDARLVALFKNKVERDSGLFKEDDFTDETKAALQEAFTILAENYVIFRMLRGWRAFGVKAGTESPEVLRDVVFDTFRDALEKSGLIAPAVEPAPEAEGVNA